VALPESHSLTLAIFLSWFDVAAQSKLSNELLREKICRMEAGRPWSC
jgi:hypothetical protein